MTQLIQETPQAARSIPVREVTETARGGWLAATTPMPVHRLSPEQALWPRYIEALFKSKYFILATILGSLMSAWLLMVVWPKKFESEAKLMIRVGRESVALDPTATTSQTLMLQKTQEEEVNAALDVLRSRRVAERTVDKLGAENINAGFLPSDNQATESGFKQKLKSLQATVKNNIIPILLATGLKEELSPKELAIMELQKTLQIKAERRSAVVSIRAFSKSPAMAQALAQTVSEEFINEYLEVTHNSGSYEFFSGQAQAANQSRSQLSEQKNRFMHERRLVTIAANQAILVEQLGTIQRDVITAQAELDQTLAEIDDVAEKLKAMPAEIVAEKKGSSDSTWSGMRQQVYMLELEERQLAAKYPADNPLLVQTREKLTGAQTILSKLESERVDESTTPNPLRMRLEEDLQRLETKVVGLRANLELRQKQRADVDQKISEILDSERDLEQIERDIKMADTRLDLLRQKNEEARVLSEMQADRISNLSLFQPATFVQRPASPNKKLLFAGIGILGLVGSASLVLFKELNSKRLRTVSDVERGLGLPVIANIGKVRSATVRTDRLLKLIRKRPKLQTEFRAILSDVMLSSHRSSQAGQRGKTLGVLGVESGVGTSTIAAALALVATEKCGFETTLIDANSENPALSKFFKLNGAPGLAELANGDATHEECVQKRSDGALSLISSSAAYKERQRLEVAPKSISAAIANFQETSDLVIVDLPPAISADRAVALSQYMDFVLLVVQSEKTDLPTAERIARRLVGSDRQVVGVVLNKSRRYMPNWLSRTIGLS